MGEIIDIFVAGMVIYFIYRFITGLILPVSKASSQMRDKFREMQEDQMRRQNQDDQNTPNANNYSASSKQKEKISGDDYIDFEEIK